MNNKNIKDKRFYGRRQGKKLRKSRQILIEEFLPTIAVSVFKNRDGEVVKTDPRNFFDFDTKEIWLEIGFGGGEHLAGQAKKNPNVGIVGSEVFINGIASLLAHLTGAHDDGNVVYEKNESFLEKGRANNVRVFNEDVRRLFPSLPDACFDRIFLLFPDPWPKKKHAERRFIGKENLPELSRLLKKGGKLRVASDDMNYIRWCLRHANEYPDFEWLAKRPDDWRKRPDDWVATRYEEKAISQGKKPIYLDYVKK